jgi:hypothetical protein
MIDENVVDVAFVMVVPPLESMRKAVVVPVEGTATTWRRFKFESEEVAEMERTARGEEVP